MEIDIMVTLLWVVLGLIAFIVVVQVAFAIFMFRRAKSGRLGRDAGQMAGAMMSGLAEGLNDWSDEEE